MSQKVTGACLIHGKDKMAVQFEEFEATKNIYNKSSQVKLTIVSIGMSNKWVTERFKNQQRIDVELHMDNGYKIVIKDARIIHLLEQWEHGHLITTLVADDFYYADGKGQQIIEKEKVTWI